MNKYVIIGIIIVILLLGGWFFTKKNSPAVTPVTPQTQEQTRAQQQAPAGVPESQKPVTPPAQEAIVTYTDSGFSPATLRVKAGTTVIFKNQASDGMWVASNPHPVHTGLPGFDALQNISPGQSYQFKFATKGTWGYHNHLQPGEGGTIIVE